MSSNIHISTTEQKPVVTCSWETNPADAHGKEISGRQTDQSIAVVILLSVEQFHSKGTCAMLLLLFSCPSPLNIQQSSQGDTNPLLYWAFCHPPFT